MKKVNLISLVCFPLLMMGQINQYYQPAQMPQNIQPFQLPYNQLYDALNRKQQQYDQQKALEEYKLQLLLQQLEEEEEKEHQKIIRCQNSVIKQLNSYKYVNEPIDGNYTPYAFSEETCDIRLVQVLNKKVIKYTCGDGVAGQVLFSQEISNGYTRVKIKRIDDGEEYFIDLYFSELFTNSQ